MYSNDSQEPAQLFSKSLGATNVGKIAWLTQVTLDLTMSDYSMVDMIESPSYRRHVAQFARNNPRAKIDYIIRDSRSDHVDTLPGFSMGTRPARFMNKGIWLSHLLRSIDLRGIMPVGQRCQQASHARHLSSSLTY